MQLRPRSGIRVNTRFRSKTAWRTEDCPLWGSKLFDLIFQFLRLVHERLNALANIPWTLPARQFHLVRLRGDTDGDGQRDLLNLLQRRVERARVEVLALDQFRERACGGEKEFVGQRAGAASHRTEANAREHIGVVALRGTEHAIAVSDRRECAAARKDRPPAAPLVLLLWGAFGT